MTDYVKSLTEKSKEELIKELLETKKELKLEQLQSKWLDSLADHLRDENEEEVYPHKEYKEDANKARERWNKEIESAKEL